VGRVLQGLRRRVRSRRPRPLILMYHRVATPAIDPWGLAVHPDRFEAHLHVLRLRRTPMSMPELVRRLQLGTLPDNAAAITFDDGYADNLHEARPRLAAGNVPATLFLAAGAVGQRREFWWDEAARAILGRRDALACDVPVNGSAYRIEFPAAPERAPGEPGSATGNASEDPAWRAWQEPRTERQRVYLELWSRLRAAGSLERDAAMARLREASGAPPAAAADLPMTAEEVVEIARGGLVEMGGHTLTHPLLPLLNPSERRREIVEGKERCERITGQPVAGFAYPYGAIDDDSRAAVRDSGFAWGCTTAAGVVTRAADLFALPRLAVQDWDGETFEKALS
jgi:peptidoglycan/xylan/chitin deacetylase (PgdA/CDA1 family)